MTAFADGSISFRLYPHALPPVEALDEMVLQAGMIAGAGFDGIMVSERHGGISGNVPNPIQVAGWLAAEMAGGWVAPCPVLALLRPPALIVEEVAWLAARYPGRVGVGLGTGGHDLDFRMYGQPRDQLAERFEPVLAFVAAHLAGVGTDRDVTQDFAVDRCRTAPVRVISAAMSREAARRAARCRTGIIGSSLTTLDRERELGEVYRAAGGTGPQVLIRHVWLGEPPRSAIDAKVDDYRSSPGSTGTQFWGADEIIASTDPSEIVDRVAHAMTQTRRTCLHLRVHVPNVAPELVREQITRLGGEVVPRLRDALSSASRSQG